MNGIISSISNMHTFFKKENKRKYIKTEKRTSAPKNTGRIQQFPKGKAKKACIQNIF